MERQTEESNPPVGLDDLPGDVLSRIFSKLASEDLRVKVPLVCKRWAAIVHGPSPIYQRVDVNFCDFLLPVQQQLMAAWFASRAGVLQDLFLSSLDKEGSWFPVAIVKALGNVPVEPQLRRLAIDFNAAVADDMCELLMALSRVPRLASKLETLSLVAVKGRVFYPRALTDALHLPNLRAFHFLRYDGNGVTDLDDPYETNWLPEGLPQAIEQCTSLRELVVMHTGWRSLRTPTFLSAMLHLRQLRLLFTGCEALPHGFTALTELQELQLVNQCPVDELRLPPSLSSLGQLTRVELHCYNIPVAVGTLPRLNSLTLVGMFPGSLRAGLNMKAEFEKLLGNLQLEELALQFCSLQILPSAVVRQARLRRLDLHDCFLCELPTGPYLQQLEQLDLRQNCFKRVPAAALAAPRLRTLAMLAGERPLQVAALGEAELAAAVAALEAKFGPEGNMLAKHSRGHRHRLETFWHCWEALVRAAEMPRVQ